MRPRLPDLQIRVRIALAIFAVATSLLVLMSAAVYVAFDRQLLASLDDSLRLRAESNRTFVNLAQSPPRLSITGDPGLARSEGTAVLRLYDAAGALLSDASPEAGSGPGERPVVLQAAARGTEIFKTVELDSNEPYRMLFSPLFTGGTLTGVLVTGLELSRVTDPIGILRLSLMVAVPLTSLLLGLGGYWIARRALRPVSEMTSAANQITSGDLTRRIPATVSQDELGRLGSTLNSMIERLSETMERERRFTSDASHELRTPLTSIETSIDVTLSQYRSPAEYQRVLGVIRGQARRLSALTRQLLLLSRLDAKAVRGEFTEIELNGFLEAIAESFRESHPHATVELERAPAPLDIRGEIELLARAFTNVLENAAFHAGPSVAIQISASHGPGKTAVVNIRDNGPGVPVEIAGEIFQRFRRGDESRHAAGSGLGLAIVQAIVEAHGGVVRLAANAGSTGACFEFHFPLA